MYLFYERENFSFYILFGHAYKEIYFDKIGGLMLEF